MSSPSRTPKSETKTIDVSPSGRKLTITRTYTSPADAAPGPSGTASARQIPKPSARTAAPAGGPSRASQPSRRYGSQSGIPGASAAGSSSRIARPGSTTAGAVALARGPSASGIPAAAARGSQIARRAPTQPTPLIPPSKLRLDTFKQALSTLEAQPRKRARAVGSAQSKTAVPLVKTKRGLEPVVQQVALEKTVFRSPKAEYVSKYIRGVKVDDAGEATQLELTSQMIDFGLYEDDALLRYLHGISLNYTPEFQAGVAEAVSVTSSLSVTAHGKIVTTGTNKKSLKMETHQGLNMNPLQVSRLVAEENEDVGNMLKMAPPDLVTGTSPEKFPLKKKLKMLRLNSESMGLLEQSVAHPKPTADEVDGDAPPEVMANLVHAIERGASPQTAPNQIFNALFPEIVEEMVNVSPAATGPLEDVVVPIDPPKNICPDAILNEDMEKAIVQVVNTLEPPPNDIATENNIKPKKRSRNAKKVPNLIDEIPPWGLEDIKVVSELVGGPPIFVTKPIQASELATTSEITEQLSAGIDYFLEADTVPFETKIQLRGSRLPSWFPGYMSAFPHLPNLIKITRTPSVVLHSAWRAVQPQIIPEDSVLIA